MKPQEYKILIEDFLAHRITLEEFDKLYNKAFRVDTDDYPNALFHIFDKLFSDIECYDPECLPGQETNARISEQELYRMAQIALDKLNAAIPAA